MSLGRYALGVLALVCVLGSLGTGAVALRTFLLPGWRGAVARLAESVIAFALLIGIIELLGTVGLFRLVPVVVASLVVGIGLRARFRVPAAADRSTERQPPRPVDLAYRIMLGVSLLAAAAVFLEWVGPTLTAFDRGILNQDSLWYHLPHAASYAQTGNITGVRFTDVDYLTGFYPATGELVHALGIVLMGTDVLSPAINLIWLLLVLLAAWCIGAPRGLGPATMLAGALVMALPAIVNTNAGSADIDAPGVFLIVAAVALWFAAMARAGSFSEQIDSPAGRSEQVSAPGVCYAGVVLAAIAAGLALSVKLNLAFPVAALTVAVIAAAPAGSRRRVTAAWFAGAVGAGGYWFLRNLLAVGNPLPWYGFGILPGPKPPPLQQHTNYSIASYLTNTAVIKHWFVPALERGFGPLWIVILAVAVVGPLVCIFWRGDRALRIIGLVALVSLVAYPLTPLTACGPFDRPIGFSDNLRYGAAGLTLALAVLPLAAPLRRGYRTPLLFGVLAAIFAATIAQAKLWQSAYTLRGPGLAIAPVVLIGAAVTLVMLKPWSRLRLRPVMLRAGLAGLILAVMLAGVAAGYKGQRDYVHDRYNVKTGPTLFGIYKLWRWADGVHHQRIAVAGTFAWFFGYPLYGSDDSNDVVYMGRRGPHGGFTTIASCEAWREALNAGHFQYVVVSAKRTLWTRALSYAPQAAWTRTDPAATPLFHHKGGRWAVQVYRLSGPLNPAGCAQQGSRPQLRASARS